MKTQILFTQTALVLIIAVFGLGCAKKGSSGFSADNGGAGGGTTGLSGGTTGDGRDTDTERGADWLAGSIATLNADYNGWTYYAATHPLNAPSDLKISVKLNPMAITQRVSLDSDKNMATGATESFTAYSGKVMISYFDNGQYYTGVFTVDNTKIASGVSHGHGGQYKAGYNRWFTWNGPRGESRVSGAPANVFHGFYEDQFGAIMLIIDGTDSQGDGQSSSLNGEVWVKNHAVTRNEGSNLNLPCFFIELAEFDCRTLLTSKEALTTTSALYPDQSLHAGGGWYPSYNQTSPARGWKLLGRFEGLDRAKAGL